MGKIMGQNITRSKIYALFLEAKTIEETVVLSKISYNRVKTYYTDFIVSQARITANRYEDKILQIGAIERKMFEMINAKSDRKKIDSIQYIYSHYNALG